MALFKPTQLHGEHERTIIIIIIHLPKVINPLSHMIFYELKI